VDILAAAELANLEIVSRRGNEHTAHCTVHDDEHASVSINTEKDVWCCYGCGAGGRGAESLLNYFAPNVIVATTPHPRRQSDATAEESAGRLFTALSALDPLPDLFDLDSAVIGGEFVKVRAICLRIIGGAHAKRVHRGDNPPGERSGCQERGEDLGGAPAGDNDTH
jgi:hypothetical protein